MRYVAERKLLSRLFEEIDKDTGKYVSFFLSESSFLRNQRYCYGVRDVFAALDQGAIETLIIWDDLETVRVTVKNSATGELELRDQKIFLFFCVHVFLSDIVI